MSEQPNRKTRLLIADDEAEIRDILQECLCERYDCRAVSSAEEVLALLATSKFDLIISDINMEGMSGLEMVPHVRKIAPETVIIMISGAQTIECAIEALRAGAFDYVTKPFDLRHVEMAVERAREHRELLRSKRCYENFLEESIKLRTKELGAALASLEDAYRTTLKALAAALETRDTDTHGHSERVVSFSLRLGRELALNEEQLRALEFGALLHDIGKIGIPDRILRKPAALTDEEWTTMRQHPALGGQILRGIKFLEGASRVVGQHHERWDGTGYPQGLRGEEIDFNARIFAVADAFDAMVSTRVYRAGKPYEAAASELERHAGRQFDPEVVTAFLRIPPAEWEKLRTQSFRNRPERITDALVETHAHAAAAGASSSSVGRVSVPPSSSLAAKATRIVHHPVKVRTLPRRGVRH
ncbi:MAG TPA: HD domain-containing phosphohydrolase [Pyrinomonadaceae bacterium]|jgi:response regulator RpfG family c-di-GMP phosphodiesterase|nr:HD domain-containing phosphohydrolase [Pyrinomonadaceae bacterium]